ncbi:hypothetical protein [uncultured Robinsoniella sp.]|uniref:hypothetical protein n=1 Tax=uncultured Robinsoniella sp. TaxID=904190 RepID=UPI00374FD07D
MRRDKNIGKVGNDGHIDFTLLRRYFAKSRLIVIGGILVLSNQFLFMLNPYDYNWCVFTTVLRGIGQAPLSAFIFGMIGDVVGFHRRGSYAASDRYTGDNRHICLCTGYCVGIRFDCGIIVPAG